jgi:hypothetical protein
MSVEVGRRQPVLSFNVWFFGWWRGIASKAILFVGGARDVGIEQSFDGHWVRAPEFEDGVEAFFAILFERVCGSLFHY